MIDYLRSEDDCIHINCVNRVIKIPIADLQEACDLTHSIFYKFSSFDVDI
jgi:hypothetical protein